MNKSTNTLIQLEAALERILSNCTKRIPNTRKLSVRAVEEEAGLGNGSCYYYDDFRVKVRELIKDSKRSNQFALPNGKIVNLDASRLKEKKLKNKYRKKVLLLTSQIEKMCAEHQKLNHELYVALNRIRTLEDHLVTLKRQSIKNIK